MASFLLLLASCSKDDPTDTNVPKATFASPVDATKYDRGQSVICSAVFEDDRELSHVDVTISALKSLKGWDDPWQAHETIELSGKRMELSAYQIFGEAIPFDIMSGNYQLEFIVVDKALNYSAYTFNINVE